ncbi:universal stress protein [uncultured Paraglaciecola sp.]|uniref:universal stress protein n=1 Tax=uncultured Paraglaciecola sp. TaxID=1765024 RepID=UPI0030D89D73|tara:strand:+ start:149786 stop:150211 length:426 start_codon:yes stop_codon:yes gene_type:complete
MKMYQQILVAIDIYSEYDQVLKRALSIAPEASHLNLVFVTLPTTYFQPYINEVGGDYVAEIHKQAKKCLEEIASKHTIPIKQVYLPIGNTAEEIHTLADEIHADLIVIGTHGRSGIKLLLGSTANSVLHGAKQDVLAVRIL